MSKELGPLANLAGTWEGVKGDDTAPSDDRKTETNKFKEIMTFEPIRMVQNHEQSLFGLRYKTVATRIGDENPFHEEVGYWLWDAKEKQVMRCFIVPRGVNVIAGGTVESNATEFSLTADVGSSTYGICSNKFLDREFKTVRYELKVKFTGKDAFNYEEDTQIKIKGQDKIFHHTDSNSMKRIN